PASISQAIPARRAGRVPGEHLRQQPEESGAEVHRAGVAVELKWDMPEVEEKGRKEAQDQQKKEFDDLIKSLEQRGINGVEFECKGCKGEWLTKRSKLRLTTVPELTEAGRKRVKVSRR